MALYGMLFTLCTPDLSLAMWLQLFVMKYSDVLDNRDIIQHMNSLYIHLAQIQGALADISIVKMYNWCDYQTGNAFDEAVLQSDLCYWT